MLYFVCLKDKAIDTFGDPHGVRSLALAERSFKDEVNRAAPDNPVFAHPADFELYHLATYTHYDGLFDSHEPVLIARGADLKQA